MIVRSWERMAVGASDAVTFPFADRHRPAVVREKKIECRRHDHLIAPRLSDDPSILFQVIGGGRNDVGDRINDVAPPVTVKIDGIALECGRHELRWPECSGPGADQMLRTHVATLKNLKSRQEFLTEIVLPPSDTGQRRCGTQYRAFAAKRSVICLDAPNDRDRVAINAIDPLHSIKNAAVFFEQCAAALDAFARHQDVEIVPDRLGELRLVVEQIHDPQMRRQRRGILCKSVSRNAPLRGRRPEPLDAAMKIRRGRPDCLSRHERMAGCARLPTPLHGLLRSRLWQRPCGGGGTRVLRSGDSAGSRKNARNDDKSQPAHARPVVNPPSPIYGCPDIISRALMVYFFMSHLDPPPCPVLSAPEFTTHTEDFA